MPRRFYKKATIEQFGNAYSLLLDGRAAKTPARNLLAVPSEAAALRLAREWQGQQDFIDPAAMPFTRIVHSAIDGVASHLEETAEDIAKYAASDLVCYRAEGPEALVEAQKAAWDKIVAFARDRLGARFICTEGVVFIEQPEPALLAVREVIGRIAGSGPAAPFALAALHVMTTLTGSVLIALAVACGELTASEAWAAAHVDEDFEMRQWGEDAKTLERRARLWLEMEAAAQLYVLVVL